MHAFEAGDRPRPFALNFCRGSAPWQRLVQSGFYEVALTLTEPSRFENQFVSIQLLQIFARKLLLGRLLQQNLPLTDILTNLITNRQHHQIGVDFPSHSIISSLRAAGTTPGLLASPRHSRRLHRACRRISRMPLRCVFFATPSGGYKEALKSYGSTRSQSIQ